MTLVHFTENGKTSFTVLPADKASDLNEKKLRGTNPYGNDFPSVCTQVTLSGDGYSRGFTAGVTQQNSDTSFSFRLKNQEVTQDGDETTVVSTFENADGLIYRQYITGKQGYFALKCRNELVNMSDAEVTVEMLPGIVLNRLTPFVEKDDPEEMFLHRMISHWSAEGKLKTECFADLEFEPSWSGLGLRMEKFGQTGSMPARNYLPFVAVEDKASGTTWAVKIQAPSSWQIEVGFLNNGVHIAGGRGDYLTGHWRKKIAVGESFSTDYAYVTVCNGDLLAACNRLTGYSVTEMNFPKSEEDIPVMYNEYCYSWGHPDMEKLRPLIPFCGDLGAKYFVMDAGWYVQNGKDWEVLGDWNVNGKLFPKGLGEYSDCVVRNGMKAGVWYEFESTNFDSDFAKAHPEYLLKRDGKIINHEDRCFWDFRIPEVVSFLKQKVNRQLADNNIKYVKVDYNENIGIGVDGAESYGEGLRQHIEAVLKFFEELRKDIPDLVLEICSSGGMRHEPRFMALGSMVSFSDAHECPEGVCVAGNLLRYMHPRIMQIWATIRDDYDENDVYFTVSKAMIGRYCLSGNIADKPDNIKRIIGESVGFYEKLKPLIKDGKTFAINDGEIKTYSAMKGAYSILRGSEDGKTLAVYAFSVNGKDRDISVDLPGNYEVLSVFGNPVYKLSEGKIVISSPACRQWGCVILLEKR